MRSDLITAIGSNNLTMESLALPKELYWDGKMEPISPSTSRMFSASEHTGFWLSDDGVGNEFSVYKDDMLELKPGVEILNGDDILVEFYDFKEDWSNDKLSPLQIDPAISNLNWVTKVHNTFDIDSLKAEGSDTAVLTTLTPPQSPPQVATPATILQHIISTERTVNLNESVQNLLPSTGTPSSSPKHIQELQSITCTTGLSLPNFSVNSIFGTFQCESSCASHSDDDVRNSEIVDEFLKSCIKELPILNDDCESLSSSSSTSSSESTASDEWLPFKHSGLSSPVHLIDDDNSKSPVDKTVTKKRTRPYGRGIEDRKIRKKEQNKNAATRYRQKKKLEMEIVLNEQQQLSQRNEELKRILAERKREVKYLKTLIKEFYRKKK